MKQLPDLNAFFSFTRKPVRLIKTSTFIYGKIFQLNISLSHSALDFAASERQDMHAAAGEEEKHEESEVALECKQNNECLLA